MQMPINHLKQKLTAGEVQYGLWLASASPVLAELAGHVGFDWCLIDGEHGPSGMPEILAQLQALAGTGTAPVVRIPEAAPFMVKQVLDMGCQTLLVPMVDDAETAQRMARAMRYPPAGMRGMGAGMARVSGYGAVPDYIHHANDQMCLLVQAESTAAFDNIDAIAAVDGVDGVFVGPTDLSADMGYPGQLDHPEVVRAIDHLITRIRAAGKVPGIVTFDDTQIAGFAQKGVTFLGVGGDLAVLRDGLAALLAKTV